MKFWQDLRRRRIYRLIGLYVVGAWIVMQVADVMFPAWGIPDTAIRYLVAAAILGFPIALVFGWFFDITTAGIVRTSRAGSDDVADVKLTTPDYLILTALIAISAAVVYGSLQEILESADDQSAALPMVDSPKNSIAVLPFVNMSGHPENEYFSDGLTETLLNMLTQNSNLRVTARTSSFAFKNKNMTIREIARELGVAHVLEGSVQRVGDRVRITAQLIRAKDDKHLWSEIYDRTLDDIFAIHDEIALIVGVELSKLLLGDHDHVIPVGLATKNIDAYDLYLRALPQIAIGSYESHRNAEELLKKALIKDPNFTDAKFKLAQNYIQLFDTGAIPEDVGIANATSLFEQVLAERPSDASSRAYLLLIRTMDALERGDLGARVASMEHFRDLVNEAPNNVDARMLFALILRANSRPDDAVEQYNQAIILDPVNAATRYMLAELYVESRQWDAAREQIERSLQIQPKQVNAANTLAAIDIKTGDALGMIRRIQQVAEMDPLDHEYPFYIAKLLYELELVDEGDQFALPINAIAGNSPAAQTLEIVRAIRADSEEQSLAVARQLIRDDADDRLRAWSRAFHHLMLTAVLRDRTEEELAFVSEYIPEFADFGSSAIPWKVGVGRAHTLEIWLDLDTEEEVQERVEATLNAFERLGLPVSRDQIVNIDILLLEGKLEAAIDAALADLFSHSVLEHMNIKDRFVTPLYAEFVADPRIAAALKRWNEDVVTMREEVREYLAQEE